jgi:hypothetical protein
MTGARTADAAGASPRSAPTATKFAASAPASAPPTRPPHPRFLSRRLGRDQARESAGEPSRARKLVRRTHIGLPGARTRSRRRGTATIFDDPRRPRSTITSALTWYACENPTERSVICPGIKSERRAHSPVDRRRPTTLSAHGTTRRPRNLRPSVCSEGWTRSRPPPPVFAMRSARSKAGSRPGIVSGRRAPARADVALGTSAPWRSRRRAAGAQRAGARPCVRSCRGSRGSR